MAHSRSAIPGRRLSRRAIDGIGLTPDVYVECSECTLTDTENDLQVQAAIETLLAVINGSPVPTSMPTSIPTPVQ